MDRAVFLLAVSLALAACQPSHEPLIQGGTGVGELAKTTGGGLKWDARASVRFTGTSFEITNDDYFDWVDVTLSVNSNWSESASDPGYVLEVGELAARRTYTADCSLFVNESGERFDPQREPPRKFVIRCRHDRTDGGYEGTWPR